MDLPSGRPVDNPLWGRLRLLEDSSTWPGVLTLKALIARLFFGRLQRTIETLHPQMTLHDMRHVETVACNIAQMARLTGLLSAHSDHGLTAYEIYFLLAASYLHDIGMGGVEPREDQAEANREGITVNEVVRRHHHERSERLVYQRAAELYLDDQETRILGLLCRSHRRSEDLKSPPYASQAVLQGQGVRLPLLAAMLRIGDELDLNYSRAPRDVRELWDRTGSWFDRTSRAHWLKHYYTYGMVIEAVSDGSLCIRPRITIRVPAGESRGYYAARIRGLIEEHLNAEIDSVTGVQLPGFHFGRPEIDEMQYEGLALRFLRRGAVRVLLIDDNAEYSEPLRTELERALGNVQVVSGALEALSVVTMNPGLRLAGSGP